MFLYLIQGFQYYKYQVTLIPINLDYINKSGNDFPLNP